MNYAFELEDLERGGFVRWCNAFSPTLSRGFSRYTGILLSGGQSFVSSMSYTKNTLVKSFSRIGRNLLNTVDTGILYSTIPAKNLKYFHGFTKFHIFPPEKTIYLSCRMLMPF